MNIISIVIIIFIILEFMNVSMLYFKPGSKMGNGIGVFKAFEASKENESIHALIKYLVYWVAGTKLIFIGLLLVILFTGSQTTKIWTGLVMVISICTFYWRLYPIMKALDEKNQITPKGYSKTLAYMIAGFIFMFLLALIVSII